MSHRDIMCWIEGSPDHWWVTTKSGLLNVWMTLIEGSPDHWWVTTKFHLQELKMFYWRVTRSLVSYDILGNRLPYENHWRVTRSLVSYDIYLGTTPPDAFNWRVTRSLVSYDLSGLEGLQDFEIEGSPDHWWVTTTLIVWIETPLGLKGHQIIGELRLFGSV